MAEADRTGWVRWLVRTGIAFVVLIVVLAIVLVVVSRPPVSNQVIAVVLGARGGAPAKVAGARIGFLHAHVDEASIGTALDVKSLDVTYRFPAVLFGRIDSVRAQSISLVAAYTKSGVQLPVVGTLKGSAAASTTLRLPSIEIASLDAAILGLPVPARLNGKVEIASTAQTGAYRFDFAGTNDLGVALPTEISATFDGAGNARFAVNAGRSGPGTPGTSALTWPKPGLMLDRVVADGTVVKSQIQSAKADIELRSARVADLIVGASALHASLEAGKPGLADVEVHDLRLTEDSADALAKELSARLEPQKSKPPLSAYSPAIDAITAWPHGGTDLTGSFQVEERSIGAEQLWHLQVDKLQGELTPTGSGQPLAFQIEQASDGIDYVNLGLGKNTGSAAHFGVLVKGAGLTLEAKSLLVLAASGFSQINSANLIGVSIAAPSKTLSLGFDAGHLDYYPYQRDVVRLSDASLAADGTLLDNISTTGLSADVSGTLGKSANTWSLTPAGGCYQIQFARLAITPARLSNGTAKLCVNGSTPLATVGGDGTHIDAKLEAGPILADAGNGSPARIQSLAAGINAALDGAPVFHLTELDAEVIDAAKSARFAPLSINGALDIANNHATGTLSARAIGVPLVSAGLDHDFATGAGSLNFDTGNLMFSSGGVDLPKLLPALRGVVTGAQGQIRASGKAAWSARAALRSSGSVDVKGFGVATTLGRIDGIDGTVNLDRLAPPRTPKPQSLHVKAMDVGLPLADGDITFELPDPFQLHIIKAAWPWAGGHLAIVDGSFVPGQAVQHVAMSVDSIDLTEIFELLSIDGLSGTGTVDGRLPIEIRNGQAYIVNGLLKARGEGVIKYTGDTATEAAKQGEGAKILFSALQNFHYQTLEIGIDGLVTGTVTVTMKLLGRNPDANKGASTQINITIQSALADLIMQTTQGLRIGNEIGKALPGGQ